MIVVDSSVMIASIRGQETPGVALLQRALRRSGDIAFTDVVYMELLRGCRTKSDVARIKREIERAPVLRMERLADFELAAELYRLARQKGRTVRQATDCMIAAVCIREKLPLLHDDADFDTIADVSALQVV